MTPQTALAAPTSQVRPLTAGIVAGPVFVGSVLVQAFTRDGFDLSRHPISLLALGDHGWIQIATFVITGLLQVACAAGLRQALGHRTTWGPRLLGLSGAGLILAGVFVTDPGAGFPAGAPDGAPAQISWHGIAHEVGFAVTMLGWLASCVVFARCTSGRWRTAFIATPVAVLVVAGWPDLDTLSVRLVVASALQFGLLAALSAAARRGRP